MANNWGEGILKNFTVLLVTILITSIVLISTYSSALRFISVDWDSDVTLEKDGEVSITELESKYSLALPGQPTNLLRFSIQGGLQLSSLYLKITYTSPLTDADLQSYFSAFDLGRKLTYSRAEYNPDEIPSYWKIKWWMPRHNSGMEYYHSQLGLNGPQFWISDDRRVVYVYDGN